MDALATDKIGSDEYLVASVLTRSLIEANKASMGAMLALKGISLVGEPSQFNVSSKTSLKALAQEISQAGHSVLNFYDARVKGKSGENLGHMLSVLSDGSRTTIFDPNYGEFRANINETETILRQLLKKYDWLKMDKVLVQKFAIDNG